VSVRAVTFDVTGTMMWPRDLGGDYARVLARHGIEVEPEHLTRLVPEVWREFACAADPARDRFAAHPGGARGFWRQVLIRVCALAGVAEPSRFASAELFEHFAHPGAWEVDAALPALLDELAERGLALGVISNWDDRLPVLLERLDLAECFDAVVFSQSVGVEKPHPAIFAAALEGLGRRGDETVHVGDRLVEDVEGARAAGLRALHLRRTGGGDLGSLLELPLRLDELD